MEKAIPDEAFQHSKHVSLFLPSLAKVPNGIVIPLLNQNEEDDWDSRAGFTHKLRSYSLE